MSGARRYQWRGDRVERMRQWLERWVDESPGRVAWHTPMGPIRYQALGDAVSRMGARFGEAGIGPGQVIALDVDEVVEAALLMLSAMLHDIAVFPLDPRLPGESRERLVRQAGVEWLAESCVGIFSGICALTPTYLPRGEGLLRQSSAERGGARIGDLRLLIATSGSSGDPKAVMLDEGNLAAAAAASAERIPLREDDRWYCCLPLFHIGGLAILLRALRAGCGVVLDRRFEAGRALDAMARHGATHVSLVPTMLYRLVASGRRAPATLRVALVGGAALEERLFARALALGWPLHVSYGMSECGSQVATWTPGDGGWSPGCAGRPLPGCRVESLEGDGAAGGRIRIAGAMVMRGYANPARRGGDGLDGEGGFVSEDLGRLDAEGRLRVVGRAGRFLNRGGEKRSLAEIRERMGRHPEIQELEVAAVSDPEWGEVAVCLYRGEVDEAALARWARRNIPQPWRPRRFVRIAAMPLLASGKVDYGALRRLAESS